MSIQLHKCPKEICSTVPQFPGMFNPKVSTLWPARGLRDVDRKLVPKIDM